LDSNVRLSQIVLRRLGVASGGHVGYARLRRLALNPSWLLKNHWPCHSERSEESRHLWNQANTEILRRLRLLRMTACGIFQHSARPFRWILLGGGTLLLAATLTAQAQAPAAPSVDATEEASKFAQVYGVLDENYMDAVKPDQAILEGAVRGMLSALDPFSAFFNRDQFDLLQQQARGEALGFGSVLYVQTGKVVVLQTAEGSPAWRAGLGPGDEIVQVNGTRINRLDFNSLIELLQRSRSQRVRLGVIHPGKLVAQDFALDPAEVALPTVDKTLMLAPGIGYIHFTGFEQKTAPEIADAVTRLGGSEVKGLLLDLRDNHGGMVDSAIGVAGLFLKPDQLVLTVRGRAQPEKSYRTVARSAADPQNHSGSSPSHFGFPLIVLVNENTASAAEVVASALQEHDRALIVGEPTFGKGVVQSVMGLSERTGLALITAQYFTPSGRSIQRPLPGTALAEVDAATVGQGDQPRAGLGQQFADPGSRNAGGTPALPRAFRTDNGRPVTAGGGITPDVVVPARSLDPWATFLNQRGVFTTFASDYLTLHSRVDPSFEPDSKVIENFREFLTREHIRAPEEYWSKDQDYLKLRIKTEIITLAHGLDAGNEVEVRSDPQVEKAAALFPKISSLLTAPEANPGAVQNRRAAK
jgi:carboxyl-terminal processing protease